MVTCRSEADVKRFLDTLTAEKKSKIKLFACDMHKPFHAAIRSDEQLAHAAIVHDPFHIMKRAGEAVTELRRQIFFRAGPELRAIGGDRWLVLRPWERLGEEDQIKLNKLFALNNKRCAPTRCSRNCVRHSKPRMAQPCGKRFSTYLPHRKEIERSDAKAPRLLTPATMASSRWQSIGRPPVASRRSTTGGRRSSAAAEATRPPQYLFRKLQFITANPVRTAQGADRFLALGLAAPTSAAA
ncbi:MAG: transposase [Polyangiaceae bacterium]